MRIRSCFGISVLVIVLAAVLKKEFSVVEAAPPQAYVRRDPGHPQWHHGAFQDVKDSVRSEVRQMLHSRAEVPFQVPLEVNIVLVGFNGDGGYRYSVDSHTLEEFLRISFPTHRPSCLETAKHLDIEHHVVYNVFPVGQPELIALEKASKAAMHAAGTARETDFGREIPLFEVEATVVEAEYQKLYSFLFDLEHADDSAEEMDRPWPTAVFVVNFDKVRIDPRNQDIDLDSFMYGQIPQLSDEEITKQEGDYIYRYRYNGGGASQVWLSSGRFVVIDLSAGPCTYGKIETEEGSIGSKSLPRLQKFMLPRGPGIEGEHYGKEIFLGQLGALIATTIEHVIAPDVRYETVDMTMRLLIPIIVLQNHNRYNILEKGHNYSINVGDIEAEIKKMVYPGQDVVVIGGSHLLHRHEKLAVAVSKATRGHSLHETKKDGRFHVRTKTFLDGAILKEEMERSADVLAAGLLEVSNPDLSNKYFFRQKWMDDGDGKNDSIIKHKPVWSRYTNTRLRNKLKRTALKSKQGNLFRTYGTRFVPVFVLSLADVDEHLMMEDESLVWTSNDVVIVLQHPNEKIPLSYVSEYDRRHADPAQAQRHILAGLASVVGGLSAPYEKASHVHERPVVNWLWASGCHPFGPFSNTSSTSRILQDVALRNTIYARVDSALHRIRETSEIIQAFATEYLKTSLGEPVKGKKNKTSTELWLEKFIKKTTSLPEPFPHELVERLEQYLDSEMYQNLYDAYFERTSLVAPRHFYYGITSKTINLRKLILSSIIDLHLVDRDNLPAEENRFSAVESTGLEEQLVDLSSLLYDHRLLEANANSSQILQSSIMTQQYVEHILEIEKEKMKCCQIEYRLPTHVPETLLYAGILLAGFVVYFVVIYFASPVR